MPFHDNFFLEKYEYHYYFRFRHSEYSVRYGFRYLYHFKIISKYTYMCVR